MAKRTTFFHEAGMADESFPEFFDFISASMPPTEGPYFQRNLHEDIFRIHHVAPISTPQFISFFPLSFSIEAAEIPTFHPGPPLPVLTSPEKTPLNHFLASPSFRERRSLPAR